MAVTYDQAGVHYDEPGYIYADTGYRIVGTTATISMVANKATVDTFRPNYATAVIALAPAAYYRLNESSGAVLTDSSGNGRNATRTVDGSVVPGAGMLAYEASASTRITAQSTSRKIGTISNMSWFNVQNWTISFFFEASTGANNDLLERVGQLFMTYEYNVVYPNNNDGGFIFVGYGDPNRPAGTTGEFNHIKFSQTPYATWITIRYTPTAMSYFIFDAVQGARRYDFPRADQPGSPGKVGYIAYSGLTNPMDIGKNLLGRMSELAFFTTALSDANILKLQSVANISNSVTYDVASAVVSISADANEILASIPASGIAGASARVDIGAYGEAPIAGVPALLPSATAMLFLAANSFATELTGATAATLVSATIGETEIVSRFLSLNAVPVVMQVVASKLAMLPSTYLNGDPFGSPLVLSGTAGSYSADINLTTVQVGEPDLSGAVKTHWARFPAGGMGFLAVSSLSGGNYAIDIYQGQYLDTIRRVGTTTGAVVEVAVSGATDTYIRVRNVPAGVTSVTVQWAFEAIPYDGVLEFVNPNLFRAPGALTASVMNFTPNTPLAFNLGELNIYNATTDAGGSIVEVSIPITGSLFPGTYTMNVIATGTDGIAAESATGTFTVQHSPLATPTPLDLTPIAVPPAGGTVVRWVFQDPTPGGLGSYRVPINPKEMTSPFAPRAISLDYSTAADGQALFWEGAQPAYPWTFSGYLNTQDHLNKLENFAALNRRFWIIDHRNRAWICTFLSFDPTPKRDVRTDYSFTYEATVLIYRGPVVVPS